MRTALWCLSTYENGRAAIGRPLRAPVTLISVTAGDVKNVAIRISEPDHP